jgi:hypothetical protein
MNLDNVYWGWDALHDSDVFPSILAIGDSWFWYPLPGGSLINQLGKLVARREHVVLAIGNNGAEAVDYVSGKYAKAVRNALKLHGDSLSAVFISGGGNDFAGFNDLRPLLNADCSAARGPQDCFKAGDEFGTLAWLMDKIAASHRSLIGQALASVPEQASILLHNYDYAYPTGKGVFGGSAWLKPALDDARVPPGLQHDCMRYLTDAMTVRLDTLANINPARIAIVHSAGTLQLGDWANELHPKASGFRKIAVHAWLPELERLGLA